MSEFKLFSEKVKNIIPRETIALPHESVIVNDETIATIRKDLAIILKFRTGENPDPERKKAMHLIVKGLNSLGINWINFDKKILQFKIVKAKKAGKGKNKAASSSAIASTATSATSDEDLEKIIPKLINYLIYELTLAIYYYVDHTVDKAGYYKWLINVLNVQPEHYQYDNVKQNMSYCMDQPQILAKHKLEIPLPEGYSALNPSIVSCNSGYIVNYRTVNFRVENFFEYVSNDEDKLIRTKNYLLGLDKDMKIVWHYPISDKSSLAKQSVARILGMEDLRLFWLNKHGDIIPSSAVNIEGPSPHSGLLVHSVDKLGFNLNELIGLCNCSDTRSYRLSDGSYRCAPQICAVRFSPNLQNDEVVISEMVPLVHESDKTKCEKNWLVFKNDEDDEFSVLYDQNPLKIISTPPINAWAKNETHVQQETVCHTEQEESQALFLHDHRGSGGPLKCVWQGITVYLVCTHSVRFEGRRRYYYSRFLVYNMDWQVVGLSYNFNLLHKGIEYCASIAMNNEGDKLLMGMGVEDKESWIVELDWNYVKDYILPIKHFLIDVKLT